MDKDRLPMNYLEKMQGLLGAEYGEYLACLSEPPRSGLRTNRLKIRPDTFLQRAPWPLEPVPWIENGFYYDGENGRPSRHPYYAAGLYYLQEPSAMTPASLLPVEPGDRVLDLCAAPGGKSTELAAKLSGSGLLFANDISNSRARALLRNLELAGVENACVSSEAPEKLSPVLEDFFDKILVDAPCSGEGMFRRDPDLVKSYRERGPEEYCGLQRSILREAVRMLRPFGLLLYSTCTFDEREDEGAIRWLLEQCPGMRLIPLPKREGFTAGVGMDECVRLFPHRIGGEGHFIALLQKTGEAAAGREREKDGSENSGFPQDADRGSAGKLSRPAGKNNCLWKKDGRPAGSGSRLSGREKEWESMAAFLRQIQKNYEPERIFIRDKNAYYLPAPLLAPGRELLRSIRYLRTGLLLGELKKDRFEPSQALAMSLKLEEYPDILDLSSADGRAARYLKGETIPLTEREASRGERRAGGAGWTLVGVDGFPLGWGKRSGGNLKNKYDPGWRWQ